MLSAGPPIAKRFLTVQDRFGLENFSIDVDNNFRNQIARGGADGISFNKRYFSSKSQQKVYEQQVLDEQKKLRERIAMLDDKYMELQRKEFEYANSNDYAERMALNDVRKQIAENIAESNKLEMLLDSGQYRYSVLLSPESVVLNNAQHEIAHTIKAQILGGVGIHGRNLPTARVVTNESSMLNDELKSLFKKHRKNADEWLSIYGQTDHDEFMAESFVLYINGKTQNMPGDVLNWFKKLENYANRSKNIDSFKSNTKHAERSIQEIAYERHAARTPEKIERIQTEWNRRRLWNANEGIEQLDLFHDKTYQDLVRLLEDDIALGEHKAFEHDFAEMQRMITAARDVEFMNTERLMKTPLFKANNDALESTFGARGTAMPFRPANELRGNPHYAESSTYRVNCQTCVVANELRRRGFDLEALANTKGSALEKLSYHTESAWVDAAGNIPTSNVSGLRKVKRKRWDGTEYEAWEKTCKNRKQMVAALESDITEDGRYHIKWTWAKRNSGHIITVERIGGRFRYYDPQNGKVITDFVGYINGIKTAGGIRWLRVDTLRVNPDIAKKVLSKPTTGTKSGKAATGGVTGRVTSETIQLRHDALVSNDFAISPILHNYDNLMTTKLYLGYKPLNRIINHCISFEEIDAVRFVWQHPESMRNPRVSPLGEGKDLTTKRAQKNISNKRKRGVEEYIEYEFDYAGQSWLIKTERHRNGFEQFYHIRKK